MFNAWTILTCTVNWLHSLVFLWSVFCDIREGYLFLIYFSFIFPVLWTVGVTEAHDFFSPSLLWSLDAFAALFWMKTVTNFDVWFSKHLECLLIFVGASYFIS